MSLLFLSLDERKPDRDARKAMIDALISAEFARVRDHFAPLMQTRADYLANVAPLFVATPDTTYWTGGHDDHFPYSEYAIEMMKAARLIPYDQTEQEHCPQCGKDHDRLWIVRRECVEMFGHFPCYRINARIEVIDPTLPTTVSKMPRDAVAIPADLAAHIWHAPSASHTFGAGAEAAIVAFVAANPPTGRRRRAA